MLLSDSLSRVVLMCGVSGSGKTFYARKLETEGYVRLSPDELVWRRYGREVSEMPPDRQRSLFADAQEEVAQKLLEHISLGHKVVVDSTLCRRAKRDHLRAICRERGVEPSLVYMKASLPVLRGRLSLRRGTGADDQIVADDLLMTYFSNFQTPGPDESFFEMSQE